MARAWISIRLLGDGMRIDSHRDSSYVDWGF